MPSLWRHAKGIEVVRLELLHLPRATVFTCMGKKIIVIDLEICVWYSNDCRQTHLCIISGVSSPSCLDTSVEKAGPQVTTKVLVTLYVDDVMKTNPIN